MTNRRAICFFSGIGIGAAVALLYAPRIGRRTRAMIASKAKKGQRFLREQSTEVQHTVAEVRNTVMDAVEQGKRTFSRAAETVASAVETGKKVLGA